MIDYEELAREVTAKIREEISKIKIVDFGEVAAVEAGSNGGWAAAVMLPGATVATTAMSCLAHYVPTVGDWVMIVYPQGSNGVIVGEAPAAQNDVNKWTAPTLLNSWVDYGAGHNSAMYMRDSSGMVRIKGVIKSGTVGNTAFILPPGCRPLETMILPVISNGAIGRINITPSGNVIVHAGSASYLSLDGISFTAEQ